MTMRQDHEGRASSVDARAWLFGRLHDDPAEAHRALCAADPRAGSVVDVTQMASAGTIAVPGLLGLSMHRAVARGAPCFVLLVELRSGSDNRRVRATTAALVRGIRRVHEGSVRVFFAFVPK